jgi:CheY-like chemotaxis protein
MRLRNRPKRALAAESQDTRPMPALKVLVAEDNPVNSLIAMKFLEGMGHAPSLAVTGVEVIELMQREVL